MNILTRIRQALMQEKPAFFGIHPDVFKDPAAYAQLTSLTKELLTDCRSSMKQKVYDPLEDVICH
jgi:hypothetical protein